MPTIRPILAIDLGSYCTRAVRIGKPDRLEELTVLGLHSREPGGPQSVVAIGVESLTLKRTGDEIVWPVNGAIQDYIACEAMLRYFTRRLLPPLVQFLKPLVIVSVATGLSEVERRATYDAMMSAANAHGVFLAEDALAVGAAAVKVQDERPWLILQIGAGAASVGIFEQGGLPHKRRLPLAGNHLDLLIRRRIWDELSRRVDLETCRALKHAVGAIGSAASGQSIESSTLNDESGDRLDPEQLAPFVRAALEAGLMQLVDEIPWFLRELPDKTQRELDRTHVLLAGGTARLPGIAPWLSDALKRDVELLDEPEQVVIRGLQTIAMDFEARGLLKNFMRDAVKGNWNRR